MVQDVAAGRCLLRGKWCSSFLADLHNGCMATNMPLENLLAKVKKSTADNGRVQADKLLFAGHLTQLMHDFQEATGHDPRVMASSRAALQRCGVPLRSGRRRTVSDPNKQRKTSKATQSARPMRLRYCNKKVSMLGQRDG